ncbi:MULTISPECIES: hypothetical protein [unclassified Streptomyces]|uniref:hypothetical protein n=1 Tax=unclassified Streptomyces TaxID=2593676 RepID=UPI002365C749|nr:MULTISPECIES: hypothetical protein [unclassified Streptomyces]MDF3140423.1 hypothetical protein [Streptomyces sp. T21Q-yed]WDF38826.1 hypothetical protein PBV52_19500 [Streptomyces sp. T12]
MEIAGWAWSGGAPFDQPIDDRSSEVGDRSDTVLDVARIARWSGGLGSETTVVPFPGALHDVLLSRRRPPRTRLHRDRRLAAPTAAVCHRAACTGSRRLLMRRRCHRKRSGHGRWPFTVFLCGRPGQPEADLLHLKSTLLTKEYFKPRS